MSGHWIETLIVLAAVALAGVYLARVAIRTFRGKSSCCGGTCAKKTKSN